MLHYVHSSPIYNSKKLERTQKFLNRRMDTENVVHLQDGYSSAIKNKDIVNFAIKWMELELVILSELTQLQKKSVDMHSLISGYISPET